MAGRRRRKVARHLPIYRGESLPDNPGVYYGLNDLLFFLRSIGVPVRDERWLKNLVKNYGIPFTKGSPRDVGETNPRKAAIPHNVYDHESVSEIIHALTGFPTYKEWKAFVEGRVLEGKDELPVEPIAREYYEYWDRAEREMRRTWKRKVGEWSEADDVERQPFSVNGSPLVPATALIGIDPESGAEEVVRLSNGDVAFFVSEREFGRLSPTAIGKARRMVRYTSCRPVDDTDWRCVGSPREHDYVASRMIGALVPGDGRRLRWAAVRRSGEDGRMTPVLFSTAFPYWDDVRARLDDAGIKCRFVIWTDARKASLDEAIERARKAAE